MALLEEELPSLLAVWKRLRRTASRTPSSMEAVFTEIYRHNAWGDASTPSGQASSLGSTEGIRARLPALLSEIGARTLLDIPCGDFRWMREVPLDLDRYIGADIVEDLVRRNQRFADGSREFVKLDMTRALWRVAGLPRGQGAP